MATSTTVRQNPDNGEAFAANERRVSRRRAIYGMRRGLWAFTTLKRVRLCGWAPRDSDGVYVRVKTGEHGRSAGLGNVQTCGSYWACPVCSEKIALTRREQIDRITRWWTAQGGRVGFVTMTVRHTRFQSLDTVWDAVSAGWSRATSGGAWKAEQEAYGTPMDRVVKSGKRAGQIVTEDRIRVIRVTEVTYGDNGWHVHVHALLLLPGTMTVRALGSLARSMYARWDAAVVASGLRSGSKRHGLDYRLWDPSGEVTAGDYLVKHGTDGMDAVTQLSFEAATGMRKEGKRGNLTPFGILGALVNGVSNGLDLEEMAGAWAEWERSSKGRRALSYTAGLLAEVGVEEVTDEEAAAEDAEGVTVATIDAPTWRVIRDANGICDMLEVFESSIPEGLRFLAHVRDTLSVKDWHRLGVKRT